MRRTSRLSSRVTNQFLDVCVVNELSIKTALPEMSWHWSTDITNHASSAYHSLKHMGVFPEQVIRVIGEMEPSQKSVYLSRFLGRYAWNRFYQNLRKNYISSLEDAGYGRIVFC